jgi:parvulin-like peptidyl-prolyl isomerase
MKAFYLGLTVLLSATLAQAQEPTCAGLDCPLAVRGEATITVADLVGRLDALEPQHRPLLLSDQKQLENVIENMLLTRQLALAFERAAEDDPVLSAKLQQASDNVLSVAQLDVIRAQRLPTNFDTLAREHYLVNKSSYVEPRAVQVRHLLIGSDKRSPEDALKLAKDIASKLPLNDQKAFADAVAEFSEDPGLQRNMGVYEVQTGNTQYDPAFRDAALRLVRVGSMTQPVKTQFGYHLIQLLSERPAKQLSFEEAKPQIIELVKGDARRRIVSEYRNELSIKGDLKLYPENLQSVEEALKTRQ